MLLAFETVSRSASACMVDADGREVAYRDLSGAEAEIGLVTMLHELIETCGKPTALALAAGPGSFTGLRIGVVAARTLAWIENLPVHAVDSLAARALEAGDGLWWVLLPLKRDATFHGVFRVKNCAFETVVPTTVAIDAEPLTLPESARGAVAIGPALTAKPGLAERWSPGVTLGDATPVSARGVALAARLIGPVSWAQVLPAYHQEAAPVLQRRLAESLLSPGRLPEGKASDGLA